MQVQKSKPGPNEILAVAARLFAERGYSNVSIRDVCKEAGTSAPMIYYYFKDKKALFRAAVSEKLSLQQFISRLRETSGTSDVKTAVSSFARIYLSAFPEAAFDPGLYMRETAKLDNKSAEVVSRQLDEVQEIATSLVERGMRTGAFRKVDAGDAADCLIGLLNHVVFQKIHFSKSLDIEKKGEVITSFFLSAMRP
ncbi:MAG TPA: TetR/AcrR family transcriptional regulator [Nitrososphaerales archaeon]|nr:TetR/AcrR family transcriptional regulator [Nitrososphaerales archaeon]